MKIISYLFALLIFFGCSNDESNNNEDPQQQDPNAEIADNVVVILKENSELISTEAELSSGLYKIQFNQSAPEIVANDVIVGDQGLGYLRRVSSVSVDGNLVSLETTQGNMEDVFGNASFNISTDLTENRNSNLAYNETINYERFAEGVTMRDFSLDISNTNLVDLPGVSLDITEGSINYNPEFNLDFDFGFFSLDKIEINTENTTVNANAGITLAASNTIPINLLEKTLYEKSKSITIVVSGAPVVVTSFLKVKAKIDFSVGGTLSYSKRLESNNTFNLGAIYENDNWNISSELVTDFITHPVEQDDYVTITESVTFVPEVIIAFYGINGPVIEPELSGIFETKIAENTNNWDAAFKIKSELKFGASVGIFGESLITLPVTSFEIFEESVWKAPDKIVPISQTDLTGTQGEALADPVKVRVFDNIELAYLKDVPVYFEIIQGEGALSASVVNTDDDGFAEVNWTLGNSLETQQLTARVKKADGTFIESIATFNAIASGEFNIFGEWTLTGSDTCAISDGTTQNESFTFPLTLNEDFTVSSGEPLGPDDSSTFTFVDNVLTITVIYVDYYTLPGCGTFSQLTTDIITGTYDPSTNTLTGTTQTTRNAVCGYTGAECNGTMSMAR